MNDLDLSDFAQTDRTLANIRDTVLVGLTRKYNKPEATTALLDTHGLLPKYFDYVARVQLAMRERLNDISVDDNANRADKTIESIQQEVFNAVKKATGYDMLYRQMKAMYGQDEAKRLSVEMYDYSLAISDATAILKPYCYAIDASRLVTTGRDFGHLHSGPAKRVSSYIAALCDTTHRLSAHLAGAIAIGTLFLDVTHLLILNEKVSLENIKKENPLRKQLENEFQQFIYSVNELSRNGIESPFTNVSMFDRPRLRALIKEMSWYFPNNEDDLNSEAWVDYVVEYAMAVQEVFIDLFDKGDPRSGGMPFRFPVATINFTKDKGSVVGREFLEYITNKDIYRYNIFVSAGTKVASCCRLLSDSEMLDLAGESNSFGGVGISLGSHRVVTINFNRIALESSDYADFIERLEQRTRDAAKILKAHKALIKSTRDQGLQPFITNGWLNLSRMFSTFGILGLVEAIGTLKRKDNKSADMAVILFHFNSLVKEVSKEQGIIGNIEQIPAESMAVRLSKVDRILFGEVAVPQKMYSNQFVPLWEDATLWERLEIDGKYNKLITGGGIVHAQIGEKVTAIQAQEIIDYAIKCGCEHFALNAVYSQCSNNHNTFGKITACPVCGDSKIDYFTRVVGFFTKVSNWNATRRDWEFGNRTFVALDKK